MHADVVRAIEARGGRVVASFVLDEDGRTMGARTTHNARGRCGGCGRRGHTIKRCNGPDLPPRATHDQQRQARKRR